MIATLPGAESIWSILDSAPADAQALHFAEPTLFLGFGDAGEEVVADLLQSAALGPGPAEGRATNASVFMNTRA
ncbi:hypothetical protein ACGF1Z_34485 [Streptomyces sp. NPDC048018]|uniref:hypothetical protein n=1 Tax=Streptomyces sp. NPDC048018 TaxID=3365499 RepID=UPI003716A9AE